MLKSIFCAAALSFVISAAEPTPADVLDGLKNFYAKTARPDGSFQPGPDPAYLGMSDSAASDFAPITYACTLHKTFGWKLPFEQNSIAFIQSRQKESGEFFNVAGTYDPASPEARTYNTTQALVALHALGAKPLRDPLGVFEEILKRDYKTLPAYSTSFFPLAYLCAGKSIPPQADRAIRALMIQDETGYTNDHIAATFHASHYYNLLGEAPPKSKLMVARILRDQKPDGSWFLNMPSRDRHATFDAVFTLVHEGPASGLDVKPALERAAKWALSCRNADGGFGHFPGSQSDADAVYFQVGTLVMAGFLKPADPLPADPHLLSWGHLMPQRKNTGPVHIDVPGWVGAIALNRDATQFAAGSSDHGARIWTINGEASQKLEAHNDVVSAIAFSPDERILATGSFDHAIKLHTLNADATPPARTLKGHKGAVLSVAFIPIGSLLASGSVDSTIKLWNFKTGDLERTLFGHKSWVAGVVFEAGGLKLLSAGSDGTIKAWDVATGACEKTIQATNTEIHCLAQSDDGTLVAVGLRYGSIKIYNRADWSLRAEIKGLTGDVWSLAFTPAGTLVSGSGDWNQPGLVTLWNKDFTAPLKQLNHTGEPLSLSVRGTKIAAGGGDHSIIIWDTEKK